MSFSLQEALLYAGAARELSILRTITPDRIERRYNCSMVFQREGDRFLGSVEPGNLCLVGPPGNQSYLVSEVEVTANTWVSLDRGMNPDTHERVWGSEFGPLRFEKYQNFADELPVGE